MTLQRNHRVSYRKAIAAALQYFLQIDGHAE
jgi:hypothetical protein